MVYSFTHAITSSSPFGGEVQKLPRKEKKLAPGRFIRPERKFKSCPPAAGPPSPHRGPRAVLPASGKKVRITIRLDREVIEWFRARVETQGGGNYQTMINEALRAHIAEREQPLEDILRRVVREEIKRAS